MRKLHWKPNDERDTLPLFETLIILLVITNNVFIILHIKHFKMTQYNISKAEQLIKDFSIFVVDAGNTRFFAAKSAIIHLEKLKELLDTDLTDFNQQIEHLKTYL